MATSRSVQRVIAKAATRAARTKRAAVKKGQSLAGKGRNAAQSTTKQVRKVAQTTAKKASRESMAAHARARKAGAAIGKMLGRAQGMGKKLVNKAKRRLT
ncbi:hypothetical protein YTPLAS72_03110 [Nitrospira sp.]|nr:hypothetical protein YTPLAS72_03110 [Nitrospira sp.]